MLAYWCLRTKNLGSGTCLNDGVYGIAWVRLNCIMVFLRVPACSPLSLFNYSKNMPCYFSVAASKDLFEVLEEKVAEDVGYEQWLASTKEALKNSKGRLWLGKNSVSSYFL